MAEGSLSHRGWSAECRSECECESSLCSPCHVAVSGDHRHTDTVCTCYTDSVYTSCTDIYMYLLYLVWLTTHIHLLSIHFPNCCWLLLRSQCVGLDGQCTSCRCLPIKKKIWVVFLPVLFSAVLLLKTCHVLSGVPYLTMLKTIMTGAYFKVFIMMVSSRI